jgi:hypothetical protein
MDEVEFLAKAGVTPDSVGNGFVSSVVKEQLIATHGDFVVNAWLRSKELERKVNEMETVKKQIEAKDIVKSTVTELCEANSEKAEEVIKWAKEHAEDWKEIEDSLINKSKSSHRLLKGLIEDFDKTVTKNVVMPKTANRKPTKVGELSREAFGEKLTEFLEEMDIKSTGLNEKVMGHEKLQALFAARLKALAKGG